MTRRSVVGPARLRRCSSWPVICYRLRSHHHRCTERSRRRSTRRDCELALLDGRSHLKVNRNTCSLKIGRCVPVPRLFRFTFDGAIRLSLKPIITIEIRLIWFDTFGCIQPWIIFPNTCFSFKCNHRKLKHNGSIFSAVSVFAICSKWSLSTLKGKDFNTRQVERGIGRLGDDHYVAMSSRRSTDDDRRVTVAMKLAHDGYFFGYWCLVTAGQAKWPVSIGQSRCEIYFFIRLWKAISGGERKNLQNIIFIHWLSCYRSCFS